MSGTSFKMAGFSGFGNSPVKQTKGGHEAQHGEIEKKCPEGKVWDAGKGKCIDSPDAVTAGVVSKKGHEKYLESESPKCPKGKTWDWDKQKCI